MMLEYQERQADLRGLDTVRVEKAKLIDIVQKNRDEHRAIFEEALEGAATEHARLQRMSLKEAFTAMGRPDLPAVIDLSTSVDVFNLVPQSR